MQWQLPAQGRVRCSAQRPASRSSNTQSQRVRIRQTETDSDEVPVKLIQIQTEAKARLGRDSQPRSPHQEGQAARDLASRVSARDGLRIGQIPDCVARSQPLKEATSLPASSDREENHSPLSSVWAMERAPLRSETDGWWTAHFQPGSQSLSSQPARHRKSSQPDGSVDVQPMSRWGRRAASEVRIRCPTTLRAPRPNDAASTNLPWWH